MRCLPNAKRAVFLRPWILLAAMTGSVFAAGPTDGAPATACVKMTSRSAVAGTSCCARFLYLKNSCNVDVVTAVRRTQHLFSGTLRQVFPLVVPAGGEQSLGCAWWSGAMASTEYELLAARSLAPPDRPGHREHHGSTRR
jgi:hypothetical protein